MKRLVLIKPVNPWHAWRARRSNGRVPPVALGILAALTPQDWEVKIIDENFTPFRYADADLVGVTALTSTAPRAYEIAARYRQSGVPTVMGGVHAAMLPEEARQYVDSIVIGEAEGVWPKVIADFESGVPRGIPRPEGHADSPLRSVSSQMSRRRTDVTRLPDELRVLRGYALQR
jgi:radical SAM superfamily enzyme YgiQ (UPF0313 family)